jgi:hypothetical protein
MQFGKKTYLCRKEEIQTIYKNADRDVRRLLKEIFASDADLLPDYQNKILEVRYTCFLRQEQTRR